MKFNSLICYINKSSVKKTGTVRNLVAKLPRVFYKYSALKEVRFRVSSNLLLEVGSV